ncbi:MAG: aminoacyl-tRNA hydrolase [Desulfatiglandales bacterium]
MYLIAGLGNPGSRYSNTRHNTGFKVINLWGKSLGVRLNGRRFQSRNTQTKFQDKEIILLRPVTFMNQSGKSIKACVDFYQLETENILIIHDDVDLPVGKIKVVSNGGAGGHKGVLSIIHHLGAREFTRVKVGVGRPRYGETIEDYVLSPFYDDEKETVKKVIQLAGRASELVVSSGVETAMNHINYQNLTSEEVTN